MSDDFCIIHGRDHMRCEKVWGAIPYCEACETTLNEDPSGQRRERMSPHPLDDAPPFDEAIEIANEALAFSRPEGNTP